MKKVILFLSFMLACAMFVNAQEMQKDSLPPMMHRPMPPMRFQQQRNFENRKFRNGTVANRFHQRAQQFNLTKEQREKIKTINDDYRKQLLQLQSNDAITLGEYKSKLAELQKDHKAQMQNIYTDEQKQKMAEAKKRIEINRKVMATARMERLKLTLNLTKDQVEKIKQQQQDLQKQLKAVRENAQLLQEQKKEQLMQIMQQHKNDLKSVLTAEQQQKLKQQRNNFNDRFNGRRFGGERFDSSRNFIRS